MQKLSQILLTTLLFLTVNINAQNNITISNGEWPPFFSKDLKHNGVTSHVIQKAFNSQDVEVQYKWYPWKRAYHLTKNGDIDASVAWSKTKEREKHFLFSDIVIEGNVVFFHLKSNNFSWNDIYDLRSVKIGSITGYEYANKLDRLKTIENAKVYDVINEIKLFELLLNKRYDVVLMNVDAGYGILNKYFSKEKINLVTFHKKAFHKEQLRVLFNKKNINNKKFLEEFNKGLKKLKETGEFKKMYEDSRKGKYRKNEK